MRPADKREIVGHFVAIVRGGELPVSKADPGRLWTVDGHWGAGTLGGSGPDLPPELQPQLVQAVAGKNRGELTHQRAAPDIDQRLVGKRADRRGGQARTAPVVAGPGQRGAGRMSEIK